MTTALETIAPETIAPETAAPLAASNSESRWANDAAARAALHEYQAAMDAGGPLDRQAFLAAHPELAECLEGMELVHGMGRQLAAAAVVSGLADASSASASLRLGEFRLLRELGRGGMGVVYEAMQEPLGRKVALKLLPASPDRTPDQLERFRREARLAARLHHTNIVPVFAVGESFGLHYYAMQFIPGQSLDRWLSVRRAESSLAASTGRADTTRGDKLPTAESGAHHPPDGRADPRGANISPASEAGNQLCAALDPAASDYDRRVAMIGMQAADALDYAHGQGVLHRDVKPANLLLDERLDVWVTDFGLARGDDHTDLTQAGEVPGTLRYLAPERFAGTADARSDVYSLGLTLYELLTLRPAFPQEDRAQLLKRILEETPPPPRQARPSVPQDLETIVLKCVAKAPLERYATAGELADDLRRFLADAPIRARRVGPWERLSRWARQNRGLATALATAALLLLAVSVVASALAYRENVHGKRLAVEKGQTADALTKAEEAIGKHAQAVKDAEALSERLAREKAQTADALNKAEQAIAEYVRTVKHAKLLNNPSFQPLRVELLKGAQTHYEKFIEDHRDRHDKPTRVRLADALYEVAWINESIGSMAAGLSAYERAVAMYQPLVDENPGEPLFRDRLATCHGILGLRYSATRPDEAQTELREAVRLWAALSREYPQVVRYQTDLASSNINLGSVLSQLARPKETLESYRESLRIHERLAGENPKDPQHQSALAGTYTILAFFYARTGKPADAVAAHRRVLEIRQQMVRDNPYAPEFVSHVTGTHNTLGLLYRETKEPEQARAEFREAIKTQTPLVKSQPTNSYYQEVLATSHSNLAMVYRELRKPGDELGELQKVVEIYQRLALANPTVVRYLKLQFSDLTAIGRVYLTLGKPGEALASFRQAVAVQERLAKDQPNMVDPVTLANSHVNVAQLVCSGGTKEPVEAALEPLGRAFELLRPVLEKEPNQVGARLVLCTAYRVRAKAHDQLARYAAAADDWEQVLALEQEALRPTIARWLSLSLAQAGQHGQAISVAGPLTATAASGALLWDLARVYALCAAAAQRDDKISLEERKKLESQYADRAVDLLRRAAKAGYFRSAANLKQLDTAPEFEALRTRDSFRALRLELTGKDKETTGSG